MAGFALIGCGGRVLGSKLAAILLLLSSSVVLSQTRPSEVGANAASGSPAPASSATNDPCASDVKQIRQAEILTDTEGVDFGPYVRNVVKTVRQNWYAIMPPSVLPPTSKQARLSIEFVVEKDGQVDKMKIDTPSGDVQLDRTAWASINGSSPFPPLPKEFSGQQLKLRFYYYYNLKPDTKAFHITPCVDVRVPAGSTLQFSVPIGGIERAAVTWSVSGPACEKAACGSISQDGLYTAPARVPDPPTVFVEATPQSNRGLPATIQLTVVRLGPPH